MSKNTNQVVTKRYLLFYRNELKNLSEPNEEGWAMALCPFHDDTNPSLSVNVNSGYFKCFGCDEEGSAEDFYMKLHDAGIEAACMSIAASVNPDEETPRPKVRRRAGSKRPIETYDYRDENGVLKFQVCRYEDKDFSQRRPDEKGGWIDNVKGVDPVPYNLPRVKEARTLFVCEGEKDCDNLSKLGNDIVATCNPGGADNWKAELNQYFRDKGVILLPDNDSPGHQHAEQVAESLSGIARAIRIVHLPGLPDKGDVSDWFEAGHFRKELFKLVKDTKTWEPSGMPTGFTDRDLLTMNIPPTKWGIRGILPEGLTILGGKPKIGKSILAQNVAIEITQGGRVFGEKEVTKGAVIFLALEDTPKRLQSRMNRMISSRRRTGNLHYYTEWPRMNLGGLKLLEQRIRQIKDLRLVVIDTLARFRPAERGKSSTQYEVDYQHVADIKALADRYEVCILLIHHLRKLEAEDVMDTFSGTLGLTGAADSLLALVGRTDKESAELHIAGRDVKSAQYALQLDPLSLRWRLLGDAREVKSTRKRQQLFDALKEAGDKGMSPKELAEHTGLSLSYVKNALPKLMKEGGITRPEYATYKYTGYSDDSDDS